VYYWAFCRLLYLLKKTYLENSSVNVHSASDLVLSESSTMQQVNTLLHYLHSKQTPPFAMLFWSALQQIDFDYTPASIARLGQLFDQIARQLAQKNMSSAQLLEQEGASNFLLAVTAYLGNYVAKTTGETVEWYSFAELEKAVTSKLHTHHAALTLARELNSSLTAKIVGTYCQPLSMLIQLLTDTNRVKVSQTGEDLLNTFIAATQQAIFAKQQVNLLDEPNAVAYQYLAKLKTGRLYDTHIGYAAYFQEVKFDYSQASLVALDHALTDLARAKQFSQADYAKFVAEPENQALMYLLGFYIGVTSSRLANVPSNWANYSQIAVLLADEETGEATLSRSIEHSFVQLMEGHYRTPILVVTNRLFGIAPSFPNSANEFAQLIADQNGASLHVFALPQVANQVANHAENQSLPLSWQRGITEAAKLLNQQLGQVLTGQPIVPTLWQVDSADTQHHLSLTGLDNTSALDKLYRQLNIDTGDYLYQVASFGLLVNLPIGQCEGIALEIRISEPALAIQLVLPYRLANQLRDSAINAPNGRTTTDYARGFAQLAYDAKLVIFPLVSNQPVDEMGDNRLNSLVALLYQQLTQADWANVWHNHAVSQLDWYALPAIEQRNIDKAKQLVNTINLPLLPLSEARLNLEQGVASVTGVALTLPDFDYDSLSWRGYDLPKHVLDTPDSQREYLQVVVPDTLVSDALFSQAEAMQHLYHHGKVVWAVVVAADSELGQIDGSVSTQLSPQIVSVAELVYDPSGQTNVSELRQAAKQLAQWKKNPSTNLSPQQSLYLAHQQDSRARLFDFAYPLNLSEHTHAARYRISDSWIWRRHLPDGVLTVGAVVPIIIPPKLDGHQTHEGRVMVLPSRFWPEDFYHYWLARTQQQVGLVESIDLMPTIKWQETQGLHYVGKGLDARIFPKFKLAAATLSNVPGSQAQSPQLSAPVSQLDRVLDTQSSIGHINTVTVAQQAVMTRPTDSRSAVSQNPLTPEMQHELKQQLLADQARLQSQLSTKDAAKERKLYIIGVVIVALVVFIWVMSSVMR
jgi:hypothetical protein